MDTNWKTLPDISNYRIFPDGKIYALHLDRFVSEYSSRDGYKKVTLRLDNKERKSYSVHRLVALAYINNPENKPTVNHIDGNKENNIVENLEWATRSEQVQHAWDNGLIKDIKSRREAVINALGIRVVCLTTGEIFDSIGQACMKYGIKKSNLTRTCRGEVGYRSAGKLEDGTKLTWSFYYD